MPVGASPNIVNFREIPLAALFAMPNSVSASRGPVQGPSALIGYKYWSSETTLDSPGVKSLFQNGKEANILLEKTVIY